MVHIFGRELVKRGFDVHALTWCELGGKEYPGEVDGIKIWTHPYNYASKSILEHIKDYVNVVPLIKGIDADVYISIECMVETWLAMKAHPKSKHIIYVQDPFNEKDFKLLASVDPLGYYTFTARDRLRFHTTKLIYASAYRRANIVLVQARYYIPKIWKLYRINLKKIAYLPNPVDYIPSKGEIEKSCKPLVIFLGRFDPQKRFWIVPKLAKKFPDIEFVMIGRPSDLYEEWAYSLINKFRHLKNLKILGFIDERTKRKILSKAWVLLLPSIREGLPLAFLEALAHKCALLSSVNPDNITNRFGYHVKNDNFERGLYTLIYNDLWKIKGEKGYNYVREVHSLDKVITKLAKIIGEL